MYLLGVRTGVHDEYTIVSAWMHVWMYTTQKAIIAAVNTYAGVVQGTVHFMHVLLETNKPETNCRRSGGDTFSKTGDIDHR